MIFYLKRGKDKIVNGNFLKYDINNNSFSEEKKVSKNFDINSNFNFENLEETKDYIFICIKNNNNNN